MGDRRKILSVASNFVKLVQTFLLPFSKKGCITPLNNLWKDLIIYYHFLNGKCLEREESL
jgi:hypothetical protein